MEAGSRKPCQMNRKRSVMRPREFWTQRNQCISWFQAGCEDLCVETRKEAEIVNRTNLCRYQGACYIFWSSENVMGNHR